MATHQQPLLENPKTSPCKITLYLILSLAAIISSTALVVTHLTKPISSDSLLKRHICDQAQDQTSCLAMISEVVRAETNTIKQMNDVHLLQLLLEKSTLDMRKSMATARIVNQKINNPKEQGALRDCMELMDLSIERVLNSVAALEKMTTSSREDAHAWLSSVLTNHVTCLDGLEGSSTARTSMEPGLSGLILRARTSLAMLVAIAPLKTEPLTGEFPSWVTNRDRRILQALPNEIKANVTVAKDGSGNYKTLKEAVASAPDNGKSRYIIKVKKGTYKENVEVGKTKKNLMIVGESMDSTIITGSLNYVDGTTTFNSATVAAVGDGFIAQDISFQNTAGPQKHQAVALRVGADQSVINRCRIDAYQDTLYAHSNRQFYRDSYITGTVDFIFGNAAVVFQNSKIVARKPMSGQKNMVTAQGRTDPNQSTGTSIQNCEIIASSDLVPVKGTVRSYLGRPWKEYSRTVVMQSNIGDHIDPVGWAEWDGSFALKTLYYGEYANKGAGAGTSKRVKWAGYHAITSVKEAKKFTVAELIQGGTWLKSTGVTYTEGL